MKKRNQLQEEIWIQDEVRDIIDVLDKADTIPSTPAERRVQTGKIKVATRKLNALRTAMLNGKGRRQ